MLQAKILDCDFNFIWFIFNKVAKTSNFNLRNIANIKHFLTQGDAFITSRFDYCNSCLPGNSLRKQQVIQNYAASISTNTKKRSH